MAGEAVRNYPLQWPEGWKRTEPDRRRYGPFQVGEAKALAELMGELYRLGATCPVLSSNLKVRQDGLLYADQKRQSAPGVAVYFELNGKSQVIACDNYELVRDNIRGIGLTVEAMRAIERHGSTSMMERAFQGFAALPPKRPWWQVLEIDSSRPPRWHGRRDEAWREITTAYKARARAVHPDMGGSVLQMQQVNEAFEQGRREWGPSI